MFSLPTGPARGLAVSLVNQSCCEVPEESCLRVSPSRSVWSGAGLATCVQPGSCPSPILPYSGLQELQKSSGDDGVPFIQMHLLKLLSLRAIPSGSRKRGFGNAYFSMWEPEMGLWGRTRAHGFVHHLDVRTLGNDLWESRPHLSTSDDTKMHQLTPVAHHLSSGSKFCRWWHVGL